MIQINLTDKTALVTGGNTGLGRAIALALAEAGVDVALTYFSHPGEETAAAIRALDRKALALRLDATDSAEVSRVMAEVAKEVAPLGITVNAVAPGLILETPFHDTFNTEEGKRATIATIPLRRGGVPDDVAGTVLCLVSDLASFVTGETTEINGGVWFT
jgi:NAD(P)-dependent dehydrogenase (short-subunit alcohol dehydrogenase family)